VVRRALLIEIHLQVERVPPSRPGQQKAIRIKSCGMPGNDGRLIGLII
jgi:hypothetical protein